MFAIVTQDAVGYSKQERAREHDWQQAKIEIARDSESKSKREIEQEREQERVREHDREQVESEIASDSESKSEIEQERE